MVEFQSRDASTQAAAGPHDRITLAHAAERRDIAVCDSDPEGAMSILEPEPVHDVRNGLRNINGEEELGCSRWSFTRISKLIITLTLGAPVDGSPERPTRPSFRYPPVSGTHAPTFVPNMGVHVRYADPPSPESSQIWVTSVTKVQFPGRNLRNGQKCRSVCHMFLLG